jgi:hypothetical protein
MFFSFPDEYITPNVQNPEKNYKRSNPMNMDRAKLTLNLAVFLTLTSACSLPFQGAVQPTATPDEPISASAPESTTAPDSAPEAATTPTASPTFDSSGGSGGSGSGSGGSGDPGSGDPGSGDPGSGGGQAGQDPCLIGLWAVDNDSMAQYLTTALNQGGEVDYFTVTEITGGLFLSFDDAGKMAISSEDYLIKVLFAPGANLQLDMEMYLVAAGSSDYTTDGQTITGTNRDYVAAGIPFDSVLTSGYDGDEAIVIEVNPSWFLATVTEDSDDPHTGSYICQGDTLSLMSNPYGPVQFQRVQN